jgi:hypothetical protein
MSAITPVGEKVLGYALFMLHIENLMCKVYNINRNPHY